MPRKGLRPRERMAAPEPDIKYNSPIAARFINKLNFAGKKSTAESVFYGALDIIAEKTKEDPLGVFNKAIENVRPLLEVRPRRVGGATYQVPMEVRPERRFVLAVRWIIGAARAKKGKPMALKLADEFVAASKNEGSAIKKKQDTHRMAEANRAFAHYRL